MRRNTLVVVIVLGATTANLAGTWFWVTHVRRTERQDALAANVDSLFSAHLQYLRVHVETCERLRELGEPAGANLVASEIVLIEARLAQLQGTEGNRLSADDIQRKDELVLRARQMGIRFGE